MPKALIIGAKGNLGHQLVQALDADYDVTGWDREDVDILDFDLIAKKIENLKPHFILNCVGYNAVDKCEDDEKELKAAMRLNGDAVGNLAKAAQKNKAIFVHYSSDYVFPGDMPEGYREEDKPKPINKYGQSKLKGEKELIKLTGKGLKWYLIRTSKLFGPQGPSELAKPSFFDLMLKLSGERDELKLVDEEVSCFTYTLDLAGATKNLIQSGKGSGIYHIANSGPCTWYEAAQELFRIAGNEKVKLIPIKSEELPRPAKRPKYSVLLNTKLEPLRDYREALNEYLNF